MNPAGKLSRRRFLRLSAAALVLPSAVLSVPAQARTFFNHPERQLNFFNTHTNEIMGGTYWQRGRYNPSILRGFCYILRDFRAEESCRIDPKLFDTLFALQARLQDFSTIDVISGYRSQATNLWLRRTHTGVAKDSYHTKGQAIDIRVPGVPIDYVHRAALSLQAGGVGYYPDSDFVHIDTGPVRTW